MNILDNNGNIIGTAPDSEGIGFQYPILSTMTNQTVRNQLYKDNPNLINISDPVLRTSPNYNFGDSAMAEPGDFTRTSPDEFYTKFLKEILNQPSTDFSAIGKPMQDYEKLIGVLPANVIPKEYSDVVKGIGAKSEQQFQDYLGKIKTPSSAEEAIRMTEGDILTQTLKDIDRDIAKSIADIKLTGEEYGVSGAGRVSEPITSAIAQAQTRGLEQKAGARSQLSLSELKRQAERDAEVRQAYKDRYERGPVEEMMMAQAYPTFAGLRQNEKEMMYKMASDEANRRLQGLQLSSNEKQNLVDNLFKTMLTGLQIQSDENKTGAQFDLQKFLQSQQIEWNKQKTKAELDAQSDLLQRKLDFEQRQIDSQPGFWESLGQNFLSEATGGFAGGLGAGGAAALFG